jgi:Domain of unknown function (DUF5668)
MAPRFILGVIIVLVGVSMLLDQLGIESADHVTRFWPVILIALGLLSLTRGRRGSITGVIMVLLGTWLLLNTLGWLMLSPWEFIVPIAIVAVGARVMMRGSGGPGSSNWPPPGAPPSGTTPTGPPNNFTDAGAAPSGIQGSPPGATSNFPPPPGVAEHANIFSVLGSSRRRWGPSVFRSAEATCMMGGGEIDLREALLGPDGLAYIDVFVLMGGLKVFVPPSWIVVSHVIPIMGGVEDKSRTIPSGTPQQLILRGTVMMGGIEIIN